MSHSSSVQKKRKRVEDDPEEVQHNGLADFTAFNPAFLMERAQVLFHNFLGLDKTESRMATTTTHSASGAGGAPFEGDQITMLHAQALFKDPTTPIAQGKPRKTTLANLKRNMVAYDSRDSRQLPCPEGSSCAHPQLCKKKGHGADPLGLSVGKSFEFEDEWEVEEKERRLCVLCIIRAVNYLLCSQLGTDGPAGVTIAPFYVERGAADEMAQDYLIDGACSEGAFVRFSYADFTAASFNTETKRFSTNCVANPVSSDAPAVGRGGGDSGSSNNNNNNNNNPVILSAWVPVWHYFCEGSRLETVKPIRSALNTIEIPMHVDDGCTGGGDSGRKGSYPTLRSTLPLLPRIDKWTGTLTLCKYTWWRDSFTSALRYVHSRGYPSSDIIDDPVTLNCVSLCPVVTCFPGFLSSFSAAEKAKYLHTFQNLSNSHLVESLDRRIWFRHHPRPTTDPEVCRAHSIYWTVMAVTNILMYFAITATSCGSIARDQAMLRCEAFAPLLRSLSGCVKGDQPPSDAELMEYWGKGDMAAYHRRAVPLLLDDLVLYIPGHLHPDFQPLPKLWDPAVKMQVRVVIIGEMGLMGHDRDPGYPALEHKNALIFEAARAKMEARNASHSEQSDWVASVDSPLTEGQIPSFARELITVFNKPLVFGEGKVSQVHFSLGREIFEDDATEPPNNPDPSSSSSSSSATTTTTTSTTQPLHTGTDYRQLRPLKDACVLFEVLFVVAEGNLSAPKGDFYRDHMPLLCFNTLRCAVLGGFADQQHIPLSPTLVTDLIENWTPDKAVDILARYPSLVLVSLFLYTKALLDDQPALWLILKRKYCGAKSFYDEVLLPFSVELAGAQGEEACLDRLEGKADAIFSNGPLRYFTDFATPQKVMLDCCTALAQCILKTERFEEKKTQEARGHLKNIRILMPRVEKVGDLYSRALGCIHHTLLSPLLGRLVGPQDDEEEGDGGGGGLAQQVEMCIDSDWLGRAGDLLQCALAIMELARVPRALVLSVLKLWKMILLVPDKKERTQRLTRWAAQVVGDTSCDTDEPTHLIKPLDYEDLVLLRLLLEAMASQHQVCVIKLRSPQIPRAQVGNYGERGQLGIITSLVFGRDTASRPSHLFYSHNNESLNMRGWTCGSKRVEQDPRTGKFHTGLKRNQGKPSNKRLLKNLPRIPVEVVDMRGSVVVFPEEHLAFRGPSAMKFKKMPRVITMYYNRRDAIMARLEKHQKPLTTTNAVFGFLGHADLAANLRTASARASHPALKNSVHSLFCCTECGTLSELHRERQGPWFGLHCGACPHPWVTALTHAHCAKCKVAILSIPQASKGAVVPYTPGTLPRGLTMSKVTKAKSAAAKKFEPVVVLRRSKGASKRSSYLGDNSKRGLTHAEFSLSILDELSGETHLHHICNECAKLPLMSLMKQLEIIMTRAIFEQALVNPRILSYLANEIEEFLPRESGAAQ